MTTKHELIIHSFHDAQATCSCGSWFYAHTGARTREHIVEAYQDHLHFRNHIVSDKPTAGPWHVVAQKGGSIVGDETTPGDFDRLLIAAPNGTVAQVYRRADARLIANAGTSQLGHSEALDLLAKLTADLLESHASGDEFETCHHDDADHPGEAPEACSYCNDIDAARQLLEAAGRDVSHLKPPEGD